MINRATLWIFGPPPPPRDLEFGSNSPWWLPTSYSLVLFLICAQEDNGAAAIIADRVRGRESSE